MTAPWEDASAWEDAVADALATAWGEAAFDAWNWAGYVRPWSGQVVPDWFATPKRRAWAGDAYNRGGA